MDPDKHLQNKIREETMPVNETSHIMSNDLPIQNRLVQIALMTDPYEAKE